MSLFLHPFTFALSLRYPLYTLLPSLMIGFTLNTLSFASFLLFLVAASGADGEHTTDGATTTATGGSTAPTSGGNEVTGAVVTMAGVDMQGSHRRTRRLRLYAFLMETFTEEQKIAATARIGQDILSYALEVYTHLDSNINNGSSNHNNNGSSNYNDSDGMSSSHLHPLNEALEDAFCILQSPLSKVTSYPYPISPLLYITPFTSLTILSCCLLLFLTCPL